MFQNSFLKLEDIPFYGQTSFCFTIRLWVDLWVAFTLWLLWTELLWTAVYKCLCGHVFLLLLGICVGVELLGSTIIMFSCLRVCSQFALPLVSVWHCAVYYGLEHHKQLLWIVERRNIYHLWVICKESLHKMWNLYPIWPWKSIS